MKRILLSAGMVVFLGAIVASGTGAFFSDSETSTGNTFSAGALDLKVDSVSHVNGLVCFGPTGQQQWIPEDLVVFDAILGTIKLVDGTFDGNETAAIAAYNEDNPAAHPEAGDECSGTWALTDLEGEVETTFFDFDDIKPGDNGENTISLHVEDNDAYVCAAIHDVEDNDNGLTEPEEDDGDTSGGDGEGELAENLNFVIWTDDGDNIYEPSINDDDDDDDNVEEVILTEGPASNIEGGVVYPLFTPATEPMEGDTTQYIGMYWCFGDIDINGASITCDGEPADNTTQTDSLVGDISFYIEQARNNEEFECPDIDEFQDDEEEPVAPTVGALLSSYVAPQVCDVTVASTTIATDTIQEGVNAAAPGQTVCVTAGTYPEDVNVNKSITLARFATGAVNVIGQTSGEAGAVVISADNVTVKGLTITEATGGIAALRISGAHSGITIDHNTLNGATGGNAFLTDGGQSNHTLSNNVFNGVAGQPIVYVNGLASVNIASTNIDFTSNSFIGAGTLALGQEASGSLINLNKFSALTSFTDVEDWEGGNNYSQNNFNDAGLNLQHSENGNTGDNGTTTAENNWWGDNNPADGDASADVDFTPFAGAAFPEN